MSANLVTNTDKKRLLTTKFPTEFNTPVDMAKVNLPLIKKWVTDQINKIMGYEDDIVTDLVSNILESNQSPNIKELQISLSGFLDKDAPAFCLELWRLCLSAQENNGIPKQLLEAKKLELLNEKKEEERQREEAKKRQEAEHQRDRELAHVRDRERGERDTRGRGGRYSRDFDRRPPRTHSRSPPRRRDGDSYHRERRINDSYVPPRRNSDRPDRRRSPVRSRSRSPPPRRRRRRNSSSSVSTRSRSRSPPRRRQRSRSRDRDSGRKLEKQTSGKDRLSRSPPPRCRRSSRSPGRPRRRRNSSSSDSRTPPPRKRHRRNSSSSRSRSPAPRRKDQPAVGDLIKDRSGRDKRRLSPQSSGSERAKSPKRENGKSPGAPTAPAAE